MLGSTLGDELGETGISNQVLRTEGDKYIGTDDIKIDMISQKSESSSENDSSDEYFPPHVSTIPNQRVRRIDKNLGRGRSPDKKRKRKEKKKREK